MFSNTTISFIAKLNALNFKSHGLFSAKVMHSIGDVGGSGQAPTGGGLPQTLAHACGSAAVKKDIVGVPAL